MATEYFYQDGLGIMGFPFYRLKPEFRDHLDKLKILVQLADASIGIRAEAYSGWFDLSDRPFHLTYYDAKGTYRATCYSTPGNLEAGLQRLLDKRI